MHSKLGKFDISRERVGAKTQWEVTFLLTLQLCSALVAIVGFSDRSTQSDNQQMTTFHEVASPPSGVTLSLGVLSLGLIGQLVILLYSENLTVFFPFGKDHLVGFRNPRATKVLLTNQIAILQFV